MNIREKCVELSTCGRLGHMRFGGVIASLFAIPLHFAIKALYYLDHQSASIIVTAAIFFLIIIVHVALHTPGDEDPSMIVVDRVVGASIALMYVPASLKLLGFA